MKHHNKHEQPRYTREKKFVAVLAAAGALGSAALASCSTEASNFRVGDPNGHSVSLDEFEDGVMPINSETSKKGSALTEKQRFDSTPEQYQQFDVSLRVNDLAKYIYQGFDKTAGYIEDSLADNEKPYYSKPNLNIPRSMWSNQDYANYYTTVTMFATGQDDKDAGKQTATVVAKPGTNTYENLWDWIEERNGVGARSVYEAVSTPLSEKELQQGTYGKIEVSEHGGRLVGLRSKHDGRITYSVMLNHADEQGNIISIEELVVNDLGDHRIQVLLAGNRS